MVELQDLKQQLAQKDEELISIQNESKEFSFAKEETNDLTI